MPRETATPSSREHLIGVFSEHSGVKTRLSGRSARWVFAAALAATGTALAFDESADGERSLPRSVEAVAWKLTTTYYATTNEPGAYDVNLRGNFGSHTGWVGYYDQAGEFSQARVGYEYNLSLPLTQAVLSAQYASQGFFGGSVTAEVGGDFYALLGISRTNEKPYFNLNFDPNDAWTFGLGARLPHDTSFMLYQIHGEWIAAGQRVTHAVYRTKPTPDTRVGIDAFYKYGPLDSDEGGTVRTAGVSVAFDYKTWFARIAWDPKVNFTPNDMVRVAVGMRF
jgi:hypothetical protein